MLSFPTSFAAGTDDRFDVRPETIDELHETAACSQTGGYFPVGLYGTWHGGVHLTLGSDPSVPAVPLYACAPGRVVTARLGPVGAGMGLQGVAPYPAWETAEEGGDDLAIDSERVRDALKPAQNAEPSWWEWLWGEDYAEITQGEVMRFYLSGAGQRLARTACRFHTEWGLADVESTCQTTGWDGEAVSVRDDAGDRVFAHGYERGPYQGLYRNEGPDLNEMLIDPASTEGVPREEMSAFERNVWASLSESEGSLRSINTYDSAFLSVGPLQQTAGASDFRGELVGAMATVREESPEAYGRHVRNRSGPREIASRVYVQVGKGTGERASRFPHASALREPCE